MPTPIMPGAEPISIAEGTYGGVLLLHGYTGTPQQIRPWAEAFAQAGFAVEAPLLAGHGTSPDELSNTEWSDYFRDAEASYRKLAEHHENVFVGGLCEGGTIAPWFALRYPATSGLLILNGRFEAPRGGGVESLQGLLKTGKQFFTWSTLPKQVEDPQAPPVLAYLRIPIAPMVSLGHARIEVCQQLDKVHCPVLVFTSLYGDDVDLNHPWFGNISGPVEHILLERSNHVATLDYDKEIIETRSIEFAHAVMRGDFAQPPKKPLIEAAEISRINAHRDLKLDQPYSEQAQVTIE